MYLFNVERRAWGFGDFIPMDILLNRADNLLPNDELTIVCEIGEVNIVYISDESKVVKSKLIEDELSKDLGNLFENEKCSDVALVVGENELKAHKVILSGKLKREKSLKFYNSVINCVLVRLVFITLQKQDRKVT